MLNEYQNGFEAAVANNRLLAPADESAKHFVLEMRQVDSNDDRTKAAAHWLITEMIGRSRQATEATDWAASETWIDEAEALGASTSMLLEARTFQIDQMAAAESAKRLPASELKLVKFVQADYPRTAVSRNMEGWVDLDFRVTSGGRTDDIVVTDASHSRLFQTEAIEAVEQWTFEPREFMGRRIDQNVYTRVRFVIAQ
jgi:TonB family protein